MARAEPRGLEVEFMRRLYRGVELRPADRPEDRARQWLRREGFVVYSPKGKCWMLMNKGIAWCRKQYPDHPPTP